MKPSAVSAADEPTVAYIRSGAAPPTPADRGPPILLASSGPSYAEEVAELLQVRLRYLVPVLAFPLLAIFLALIFRQIPTPIRIAQVTVLTILGGVTALVWNRRRWSLSTLRLMELAAFAALAGLFIVVRLTLLGPMQHDLATALTHSPAAHLLPVLDELYGLRSAVDWIILIIAYGVFIPNTWQRCAAVVVTMAVTALAVHYLAYILVSTPWNAITPVGQLFHLTIMLTIAGTIAILGAHRLSTLQRESFDARRLGQYHLQRKLGAGGMGEVYLADHALLRRPCAVKLIRTDRAADPSDFARFEREVRMTAGLSHPNTVQIYDYGRARDGTFYYVMEYLPGRTLEELVRQYGPLSPARGVYLLVQLCGALGEAHNAGLIHRDIKPGNVMICRRGGRDDVAKLLDFGLVRSQERSATASLTDVGTLAGTPAYMSPEQAAGRDLDPRSDLYSLGALAYFLLRGRPPFVSDSPAQLIADHFYRQPEPLCGTAPGVSPELDAVILRCLAKDPADRFASAAAVAEALAGCPIPHTWTAVDAAVWWREHPVEGDSDDAGAG